VARYDFRCQDGHTHERLVPAPPAPTYVCPTCGGLAKRVFTSPMVPVLDEYIRKFRLHRRPNPGDDIPVEHDSTIPEPLGHDTKRRLR
jgi:hypothetical protein